MFKTTVHIFGVLVSSLAQGCLSQSCHLLRCQSIEFEEVLHSFLVSFLEEIDLTADKVCIFKFWESVDTLRGCDNALLMLSYLPLYDAFHDQAKLLATILG